MKCPRCTGRNTKKVSVRDPLWKPGHERCQDCGYQDDWVKFLDPPFNTGRKDIVIE